MSVWIPAVLLEKDSCPDVDAALPLVKSRPARHAFRATSLQLTRRLSKVGGACRCRVKAAMSPDPWWYATPPIVARGIVARNTCDTLNCASSANSRRMARLERGSLSKRWMSSGVSASWKRNTRNSMRCWAGLTCNIICPSQCAACVAAPAWKRVMGAPCSTTCSASCGASGGQSESSSSSAADSFDISATCFAAWRSLTSAKDAWPTAKYPPLPRGLGGELMTVAAAAVCALRRLSMCARSIEPERRPFRELLNARKSSPSASKGLYSTDEIALQSSTESSSLVLMRSGPGDESSTSSPSSYSQSGSSITMEASGRSESMMQAQN
eukprot:m.243899 g.243899  ORF g.243899 m.243899 type:complete len:326 (-) comp14346_c0_seq1:83-1060(-)